MSLFIAIVLIILADTLAYLQMYGPTMWKLSNTQTTLLVVLGIPISYLFMLGTKYSMLALETQMGSRVMFLLRGNLVFVICAIIFAGEIISTKNSVLLGLTLVILLIQVFWK